MSRVASTPIKWQPNDHDMKNVFGLLGNEIFLSEWRYEKKGCGYVDQYYMALSDTRLFVRVDTKNCRQRPRRDVSIFLRDIAEIREIIHRKCSCIFFNRCCRCCCPSSKLLEVRGTFGSQILYLPEEHETYFKFALPAAIGNHKLVNHGQFIKI